MPIASGDNDLDWLSGNPSYWYHNIKYRYNTGVSSSFTAAALPEDSPQSPAPAALGSGFLRRSNFHTQFDTHLVVGGGWLPNGPEMAGYPIALSTAQWHLDGTASNANAVDLASTTNMANWNVKLASGNGPSPATLPCANVPWTASGDNARKYITYDGNSQTDLGDLATEANLASPASEVVTASQTVVDLGWQFAPYVKLVDYLWLDGLNQYPLQQLEQPASSQNGGKGERAG